MGGVSNEFLGYPRDLCNGYSEMMGHLDADLWQSQLHWRHPYTCICWKLEVPYVLWELRKDIIQTDDHALTGKFHKTWMVYYVSKLNYVLLRAIYILTILFSPLLCRSRNKMQLFKVLINISSSRPWNVPGAAD